MSSRELILCLIMRNEARCIERCLASVRPYVDRMVVLDTGSVDDSIARARAAGAEVHEQPWPNSFAAARNTALGLAGAYDFALILDADEWLISGGEALRAFVDRHDPASAPLGTLRVDSRFEQAGLSRVAPSWLPRLLPAGIRYCGRVHEQPTGREARQRLSVAIGHDGYEPAQLHGKRGRNRLLLQAQLARSPEDSYLQYQLGKDAMVDEDWDVALSALARARLLTARSEPWRHDLVVRSVIVLRRAGHLDEAIDLVRSEITQWDTSPDLHFAAGDLALDCAVARPAEAAATYFPMIERHWLRALALGDRPELEGAVIGHGSFLAAHNLGVYYQIIGQPSQAQFYRDLAARLREQDEAQAAAEPEVAHA